MKNNRKPRTPILALTLVLVGAASIAASLSGARAFEGETYALRGGTIVTVTGATITNGTLVIRNGLIADIGQGIAIPGDASVIDATGMTIYPGLFDSLTSLGIPAPTPTPGQGGGGGGGRQAQLAQLAAQAGSDTAQPPPGLEPAVTAASQLRVTAETFDQQRSAGITTALTAPRAGVYQGQSALINLGGLGGDSPEKLILKSPATLNVGFQNARFGTYPGSLMGVFAFLRQSLLDAQHYRDEWARYKTSKRGMARPQVDSSLAALQPVINGELPVVFQANTEREIKRAVALGEEFKLKFMIAGATESYDCADFLKQKKATVLLSLNFPQRPAGLEDPESESLRVLRMRADAPKAAAALNKAGVRFAFESGYLARPHDLIANAARAIEAGLPRDVALKALTIYPAEIFGVSEQLGSLEKGKIANVVVTSGDIFDRNTRVKYVFVDGRQYEVKAPETVAAGAGRGGAGGGRPGGRGAPPSNTEAAPAMSVAGVWTLNVEAPDGAHSSTLNLHQDGAELSGDISTPLGNATIGAGRLTGNEISLEFSLTIDGQPTPVSLKGTIQGNALQGTVAAGGQNFPVTGTRAPR
jgi:imidazolonepropionase-like amidohydrolase